MKIFNYNVVENLYELTMLWDDGTFLIFTSDKIKSKELLAVELYRLGFSCKRQKFEGEIPDDAEYWFPNNTPTKLMVNFKNLDYYVLDQYDLPMDLTVEFFIEGTDKAKIIDGEIIEDEVDEDTTYYVVAKVGDLTRKDERVIKASNYKNINLTYQAIAELSIRQAEIEKGNQELKEELKHLERK